MREIPSASRSPVRRLLLGCGFVLLLTACSGPLATGTTSLQPVASASSTIGASKSPHSSASPIVPAGFPVLPGSQAVTSLPDDPQLLARWTAAANGAQVYAFYLDALPAAGFEIDQLAPGGEAAIIRFSPPGGPRLQLSLTAQEAGTRIDLRLADAAG
jgi:hypothetical protein